MIKGAGGMVEKSKKFLLITLVTILLSIATTSLVNAQDYYPDSALFWGFGVAYCIAVAVMFIIGILIAIWVYRDAEKRGSSGVLWLIIVLLTSIIGLIIWLVVRPPIGGKPGQQPFEQQQGRVCTNCGRPIPMDAQVCPYCGKDYRMK